MTTSSRARPHIGFLGFSLYIIILLQAFASSRFLARGFGFELLDAAGGLATGASVGVAVITATYLLATGGTSMRSFGRIWLVIYSLLVMASLGTGLFFYQNDLAEMGREFATYAFFGSAVVIGSSGRIWAALRGPLLLACILILPLSFIGFLQFKSVASEVAIGTRLAGSEISINNLSSLFSILPLVLFTLQWWGRFGVVVICLCWSSAFILALLQQSRLEAAYWVLCGVIAVILVTFRYCTLGHRSRVNLSFYALIGSILLCIGSVAYLDASVRANTNALLNRLSGEDQERESYGLGFMGNFSYENERFKIFQDCWNDFSTMECVYGRGMGGSFEWLSDIMNAPNQTARHEREEKFWLEDSKKFGRRQMEFGWGNPFIKGGLLFSGWIVLASFAAISAAIRSHSRFAVVCGLAIFVNAIYTSFGGDFLVGSIQKLLCTGLLIGFLLSREWRSDPWVGVLRERVKPVRVRSTPTTASSSAVT